MCACGHSSASLPEPWAAGPDTAGRRDLQTMFMTVGLLLGLAKKNRLYTHTHKDTHTGWPGACLQRLGFDVSTITLEDPERGAVKRHKDCVREREKTSSYNLCHTQKKDR